MDKFISASGRKSFDIMEVVKELNLSWKGLCLFFRGPTENVLLKRHIHGYYAENACWERLLFNAAAKEQDLMQNYLSSFPTQLDFLPWRTARMINNALEMIV